MVARTLSFVTLGVDARLVVVEADVGPGLPGIKIVGLADTAISEARDRVRAAASHSDVEWPRTRITIALLPAGLPKRGAVLDAAIAVAILAASDQVPAAAAAGTVIAGEIGLDGRIHATRGVIAAALTARRQGVARMLVPEANVAEARLVPGLEVGGVSTLAHLVGVLRGDRAPGDGETGPPPEDPGSAPDLADVHGQDEARRALEIAAAGAHHLAMVGPPGVGKTLLAERLPGLLPELSDDDAVEVTAIRSVAGRAAGILVRRPPFEAPHHSASPVAVIGGGQSGRVHVGAVTLAHRGVLFLDEAPEFPRGVLEALRQPLESGTIRIARSDLAVQLPARFHLVIAANPCPCGRGSGMGSSAGAECSCSSLQRRRYASRLSGPILDRLDLRITLGRPTLGDLGLASEASCAVAPRIAEARARARHRWAQASLPWATNAEVPGPLLRRRFPPDPDAGALLRQAVSGGALSLRGADRVLRVGWTLADLSGRERPVADDIGYAMSLRGVESVWAA